MAFFNLHDIIFFPSPVLLFACSLIAVLSILRRCRATKTSSLPLPPGPQGHWLWGNKVPEKLSFVKYHEWTKKYGPVFSLRNGRQLIIVVGGHDAAMEILEKNGTKCADRPPAIAGQDIISGGMRVLLSREGERLRLMRRALHLHLQPRVAATYESLQAFNAKHLVRSILDDPRDHYQHAQSYASSVILSLTYGKPSPTRKSEPDVGLITEYLYQLGQALLPGARLVEYVPWLKYVPFYARDLRKLHRDELALFQRHLKNTRIDIDRESAPPSFGKYLLESQAALGLSSDELAYLAGSMFGAGSETTAAGILSVIMAAALYPEAQARVAQELDEIVGSDRLPSFSDRKLLPQVEAFVTEMMRWRPGIAGGIAHAVTDDIVYNGYLIPRGSTIIGNHWSIGRDPAYFPDGEEFDPQRWINQEGSLKDDLRLPNFGFGRRVCPGMPVATRSLFITTALLMWSFRIRPDPDHSINKLAFAEGVITFPEPFPVMFEVRRENLRDMLDADTQ